MNRCEFDIIGGCEVYSYFIDGKRNKMTSAKGIKNILSVFKSIFGLIYSAIITLIAAVIMKINKFEKLPPEKRVGRFVTYSCIATVFISIIAAAGAII